MQRSPNCFCRAKHRQPKQPPQECGQNVLFSRRKLKIEDAVPRVAQSAIPKALIDGDERRRLQSSQDFGDPIIQDMFPRTKRLQSNDRYPRFQGGKHNLHVELIVQNELAHDFLSL